LLGLLALLVGGGTIIGSMSSTPGMARSWLSAGMIILTFCFLWGYFTLFEALNGGRTPGKQALGIRVVMDTGRSITPAAAVVRNRFLGRINDLTPEVQIRITTDLVRRFESRIPRRSADLQSYLVTVFVEEQRKRRSRFAPRAKAGAAGRITVPAERFVQKKRQGWETFRTTALRMERSGVGALAPGEIPTFAAQYREVAADLARARTYQVDPRVIAYLERVVTAGHNALYRARGRERTPLPHYILRDFPAAVVQSWRYVLLAFLLFAVPAVVGYVMIRERPTLAEELLSPVMVARAEAAAENRVEGRGYAETEKEYRPQVAAFIITNNI